MVTIGMCTEMQPNNNNNNIGQQKLTAAADNPLTSMQIYKKKLNTLIGLASTNTQTQLFNDPLSRIAQASWNQK